MGRRARRKLSDENANSFLVKEEKAWCRIFSPWWQRNGSIWFGANPVKESRQGREAGTGSLQRHRKNNPFLTPTCPHCLGGHPPPCPQADGT